MTLARFFACRPAGDVNTDRANALLAANPYKSDSRPWQRIVGLPPPHVARTGVNHVRLCRYEHEGRQAIGLYEDAGIVPLGRLAAEAGVRWTEWPVLLDYL